MKRIACLLLVGLVGCGDESAGDDPAADYAALEACPASACAAASTGRYDIGGVNPTFGFDCVLPAVRDRVPGVYRVDQNHQWAGAMADYHHVVVVTPAGDALWATESEYSGQASAQKGWQPFTTVKRCGLKPPSFFNDCLASLAINPETGHGASGDVECVYPEDTAIQETSDLPWFENCREVEPTCE